MTLAAEFASAFHAAPQTTAAAPGRVNLIGEHTDYNGGWVLPAALSCHTRVALAGSQTPSLRVSSTQFDGIVERPMGDPKRGDWTDYATGALAQAQALGWLDGGAMLHIQSDVPNGAGVSSSAALITAILRAAADLSGISPDPVHLAQAARAVENDYIGLPCGIMDQMAVGLCDPGKALALDTYDLSYDVLDIPEDWAFITLHSGIRRELADGRYSARFEECRQATEQLGAEHLCRLDADQAAAARNLPAPLRKRATHVITENTRTQAARQAMLAQDMAAFAALMNESHHSYSHDFEASTPEIDALVEDAVRTGAKGARLTGGGFGGCIVVLIETTDSAGWLEDYLARHPAVWQV